MNSSKTNDPRFWEKWKQAGAIYRPHRIGLSISFCIRDIATGKVAEQEVEKIIAGTMCADIEEWEYVIASYRQSYWQDCADQAEAILRRLIATGKIWQPRLEGLEPPQLATKRHETFGSYKWAGVNSEVVLGDPRPFL